MYGRYLKLPQIGARLRLVLQLVAAGALLTFLLSRLDWQRSLELIRGAQPLLLATVVLIQMADRVLMALKWHQLLRVLDARLGRWAAIRVYYESTFIGFALPLGSLGPDVVRFVRLRGCGIDPHTTLASMIMERAIGVVATLVFIATGFMVLAGLAPQPPLQKFSLLAAAGAAAASVVAAGLIFHLPLARKLFRLLKLPALNAGGRLAKYVEAANTYSARRATLLGNLGLSLGEQTVSVLTLWVASHALNAPVPWIVCLAVAPAAVIIQRLPLTYAGLGLREGSAAALLVALGYDYSAALILLMATFATFLVALIPGALILMTQGRGTELREPDNGRNITPG